MISLGLQAKAAAHAPARIRVSGPLITTPQEVRDAMGQVDASVKSLNADVQANVTRQSFRDGWDAFKRSWDAFVQGNQSLTAMVTTGTGTILRETESRRLDLVGWQSAYQRETGRLATASAPGAFQVTPEVKPSSSPSFFAKLFKIGDLPTWMSVVLVLTSVGTVVWVGYAGYKAFEEAKVKKKIIERRASELLMAGGGDP